MINLPRAGRGRKSAAAQSDHDNAVAAFCAAIVEIRSTLDFDVSSRGWAYILEEHGLAKGDFSAAENLIRDCRKRGLLPLDIVAEDNSREFDCLERLDLNTVDDEADSIVEGVKSAHRYYRPYSLWDFQDSYVQMLVEKIDLKSLFRPICAQYHVPLANARGWSDLHSRANLMRRFAEWESKGKRPVLLYCGDHDPAGLNISAFLRSNFEELAGVVGWSPDNLVIERFGLNHDFIAWHSLSWVDNLETGSGKRLDDPKHPDHDKPYVRDYIARFGARKVEANALVVRPEAGRDLCRAAIERYLDLDRISDFAAETASKQRAVAAAVAQLMAGAS